MSQSNTFYVQKSIFSRYAIWICKYSSQDCIELQLEKKYFLAKSTFQKLKKRDGKKKAQKTPHVLLTSTLYEAYKVYNIKYHVNIQYIFWRVFTFIAVAHNM